MLTQLLRPSPSKGRRRLGVAASEEGGGGRGGGLSGFGSGPPSFEMSSKVPRYGMPPGVGGSCEMTFASNFRNLADSVP